MRAEVGVGAHGPRNSTARPVLKRAQGEADDLTPAVVLVSPALGHVLVNAAVAALEVAQNTPVGATLLVAVPRNCINILASG